MIINRNDIDSKTGSGKKTQPHIIFTIWMIHMIKEEKDSYVTVTIQNI